MLLTLMRHGHAESGDHPERVLSALGRVQVRTLLAGLRAGGWMPGAVVCSPILRARQTAELVMELFPDLPLEVLPSAVDAERELLDEIAWHDFIDPLVIGHLPGLPRLAAELLQSHGALRFPPGAAACLRLDGLPPRRPAELVFLVPPPLVGEPRP